MPLDTRESAKSIELQLEEPIGMVEGGGDADEGHGRDGYISASQIKGDGANFSAFMCRNSRDENLFLP
jgi:hypothetical protein